MNRQLSKSEKIKRQPSKLPLPHLDHASASFN